jgi:hypothetical protein
VLLDAAGQPLANHMIHRSVITRGIGGALQYSGPGGDTRTDAAGAFAFTRLSPGEYLILTGNDAARSAENVVLGDGESRHVIMTPRRETAVKGTVVTDDGLRPAFAGSRLRVVPIPIEADRALQRWGEGQPQSLDSTGTFQLTGLDGGYLFRLTGLPAGWTLTSVTLGGRDITDTPLGVERGSPDVTGLRVVVSQKSAAITGSVTDREGKPSGDASVIVFAENSALWGPGSRYIAAVPLDRAGRFSVALPPGVYRAIARDAIVDGQWEDPEFLQALVKDTVRVELGAGGTETVTLTLDVPR